MGLFLDPAFGPISYFGKEESKPRGSFAISPTEEFCHGDLQDDADFSEAPWDTEDFLLVSLTGMPL